ncbi:MAG: EamA family transporter [Candidatus Dormibacteraeota bacterium]|nr:EamA family transporter [Candidatus Dormibacteraeota bacterium]MBV9524838.1 EamA family transporter [Candidatus Dormibacteraeota bacterium]
MLSVLIVSQAVGLAGMAVVALSTGGRAGGADLLLGAAGGIAGGAGVAMLYRGLASGTMALVAPVTGVVAAIVPVVVGVALGDRPGRLQFAGVALAVVAVALLSSSKPRAGVRFTARTALLACGAGAAFGLFYIALARTAPAAGFWPLVTARGASVTAFAIALLAQRAALTAGQAGWVLLAATGVFDVSANALYLIAVHNGLLSIVAVLVSLYPAATVACSLLFLGERLRALQIASVGVALAAVTLITAG